jgi:hypothetical protein
MVLNGDLAGLDKNRYGSQSLTLAGSGDTKTIIYLEQGIVRGALDKGLVEIKKLVRHPVKRSAGMRATVQVGIDLLPSTHDKGVMLPASNSQFQTPATRISEIIELADDSA